MSIIRVEKREHPYVILDKTCVEDTSLSWRAKGLHAYLIGLPDNWQINSSDLVNRSTEGREAVRTAINELSEAGYMKRTPIRDDKGRVQGTAWTVTERPENRSSVKPTVDESHTNKDPTQTRNEETTSPDFCFDQSSIEENMIPPPPCVVASKPSAKWAHRMTGIWAKHCGIVQHGRMGRALKAAVSAYGEQSVAEALYAYCSKTDPAYASPEGFSTRILQWLPKVKPEQELGGMEYTAE